MRFLALMAALVLSLVSGCSELIPGLNMRMDGSGNNSYRVVQAKDGEQGYKVEVASSQAVRYQIIPVDADVLLNLKREAPSDFVASAVMLPSIVPSDVPPEYRIGPGDVVYATVWDHPELAPYAAAPINDISVPALEGRLVSANGTFFFPYVGVIKVSGMTAVDLRSYLVRELAKSIVKPQVDVRVVAYRAKRIEVTGEVLKPGTINLDDTPKGILEAIDAAGGLTPAASRRRLTLVRNGRLYPIDLAGLLSGNRLVPNTAIASGDVIHVPDQSADQVFLLGAVLKQQPVFITQDSMTLTQALAEVGGLDPIRGKQSGFYIFHMHDVQGHLEASVYALDLSRPDGVILASEFPLSPRDVVYVDSTQFSKYNSIITQLLPTVTTVFELNQLTK